MLQKFGLAIELAKELAFLRRQVNGYVVVHSTENGVLLHTDMSMSITGHLGTPKPKIFHSAPNMVGPPGDTILSK